MVITSRTRNAVTGNRPRVRISPLPPKAQSDGCALFFAASFRTLWRDADCVETAAFPCGGDNGLRRVREHFARLRRFSAFRCSVAHRAPYESAAFPPKAQSDGCALFFTASFRTLWRDADCVETAAFPCGGDNGLRRVREHFARLRRFSAFRCSVAHRAPYESAAFPPKAQSDGCALFFTASFRTLWRDADCVETAAFPCGGDNGLRRVREHFARLRRFSAFRCSVARG